MVLKLQHSLDLPTHALGGFDHGDVFEKNGFSFVAHTTNATVEMYEGYDGVHLRTITDVPEGSGVICAQAEKKVYAASRATGRIIELDGTTGTPIREVVVGKMPNGLAWDSRRHRLLVADVGDFKVRVLDTGNWSIRAEGLLPGKPRWCKYSPSLDRYVVNVHTPSSVAIVRPEDAIVESLTPLSVSGAHGLDLDGETALVACDGGALVAVDLNALREIWKLEIRPNPDVAWLNISRRLLYIANSRPGVVQVVDVEKRSVTQELTTEEGCHTLAFHQEIQKLHAYLPRSCRVNFYRET